MISLFAHIFAWPEKSFRPQPPSDPMALGTAADDPRLLAAMACDLPHANRFTRKGK
jgi:hypothetical protein